jgi:DNA (cytosine-5)-methyltransferase 1
MTPSGKPLTSIEICAGAGGQAVGLEAAGFRHLALVEIDPHAVATLRANVHRWEGWDKKRAAKLQPTDVRGYHESASLASLGLKEGELDLLAGGVPCPPFSLAGQRLGKDDERDLFPDMLKIVEKLLPKAVMIENVRGILEPPEKFIAYRREILRHLASWGYSVAQVTEHLSPADQDQRMRTTWRRLDARDYGVPQLRPRAILVAIREDITDCHHFLWPKRSRNGIQSVFEALNASMKKRYKKHWDAKYQSGDSLVTGEEAYKRWAHAAQRAAQGPTGGVAPTLVGGSKKHGGADLGPSRAKRAWEVLGVDANGVANDLDDCDPARDLFRPSGPMLTVAQAALLQGFPPDWEFQGGKTARYRQVGNAFPPPVAQAVGSAIAAVLREELMERYLEQYEVEEPISEAATPVQQAFTLSPAIIDSEVSAPRQDRRGNRVGAGV